MAELMDHVSMIAEEIGPRPVSTEEEHEAAEYVAQGFRDAGLDVDIDEFTTPTGTRWPYAISFGLIIVATLVSGLTIFIPGLTTSWYALALLLTIVGVAIYFTEHSGRPILSKMFARGVSQNVVARYVPASLANERRRRKIIFVAHVDTTRAQLEASPKIINNLPLLKKIIYFDVFGLLAVLFIRLLPFPWPAIVDNILLIISLVGCLLLLAAVVCIIAQRFTGFVSGANDNASSLAVLMNLAERFQDPAQRHAAGGANAEDEEADLPNADEYYVEGEVNIHGKDAAIAAGLVPEGAEIAYADELGEEENISDEYVNECEDEDGEAAEVESGATPFKRSREEAASRPVVDITAPPAPSVSGVISTEPVVLTEEMRKQREAELAKKQREQEEELARLRAEQEAKELEEKQKSSGLPSWYVTARERASHEEDIDINDDKQSMRSRFADTPMTSEDLHAMMQPAKEEQDEATEALREPDPVAVQEKLQPQAAAEVPAEVAAEQQVGEGEAVVAAEGIAAADSQAQQEEQGAQAELSEKEEKLVSALPWLSGSDEDIEEIVASAVEPISAKMPKLTPDEISAESIVAQIANSEDEIKIADSIDLDADDDDEEGVAAVKSESGAEQEADRPSKTSLLGRIPTIEAKTEDSEGAAVNKKEERAAKVRPARRKPRARTVSDDFVPTKAVEQRDEGEDFLSMSRQKAAVSSEYVSTPQAGANPALSSSFNAVAKDDFAAGAPEDLGATSAFPSLSSTGTLPSLTGSFPSLSSNSGAASPSMTGAFPSLTGTFSPVSASSLDASDFAGGSDEPQDSIDIFAQAGGPEFEVPESKFHDAMENVTGLFSRIGRKNKKKNKRNKGQEDDPWASIADGEDDFGWKGGGYVPEEENPQGFEQGFDQPEQEDMRAAAAASTHYAYKAFDGEYDPEQALRERAAKIRESVVAMTENDMLDKEVWFVGLGASAPSNRGMKNFLELHASELRGALIVNLEGIGSGDICFVDYEGGGKVYRSDRRLQSLVRKTSKDMDGEEISAERLDWRDTDATPALSNGMRAMTIMGFDGVAPTAWRTIDDTVDVIEEEKLEYVANLLLRMIENA